MALRHLIIAAALVNFGPAVTPVITTDKAEAVETVKKKKKKTVQKKSEPVVKKNYRAPRPGEPNAGWTHDCLFYYDAYGRLLAIANHMVTASGCGIGNQATRTHPQARDPWPRRIPCVYLRQTAKSRRNLAKVAHEFGIVLHTPQRVQ